MILKKNNKELFGIPYQGSKTKIISEIARCFPNAENFYDLFGGGFSVTHYMMSRRSRSFRKFHYNEIRPGMCELIRDSILGKYNYEVFKPEWITRERFMAEKDSNAYIKIIWSFGNNGKDYLFGVDIEGLKKSMHMAVVYDLFDETFVNTFMFKKWPKGLSISGKRLFLKKVAVKEKLLGQIQMDQLTRLERLQNLQQLQQLERLQQLEKIQHLNCVELTNSDYREVKIKPNSIIYCDIPYRGTANYGGEFDHDEFYEWASNHIEPVFVSEYKVDHPGLKLIKSIAHRTSFSKEQNTAVIENLYGNAAALRVIKEQMENGYNPPVKTKLKKR